VSLAVGYLVVVQGEKFLGHSGKLVSEFPDARIFATQEQAFINAADYQRRTARRTQTMSVADYDAGVRS